MLENPKLIRVSPVIWSNPLTKWFNNDLIAPTPRPVAVWHDSSTHIVPVHVKVGRKRMTSTDLKFYRALGLNV